MNGEKFIHTVWGLAIKLREAFDILKDIPKWKLILIIDDDKEIVELLAVYLRNEGYNIYKAYDGDEALQGFYI